MKFSPWFAALLVSVLFASPLLAQTDDYDPYRPDPVMLTAADSGSGKVKKPGTAKMVVGIVFTPIFGVAALTSALMYSSAASYDCDLYKDKEDDSPRGKELTKDRGKCQDERKETMQTWAPLTLAFLGGVGASVWMIVSGAQERHGADAATQGFDVIYSADRQLGVVYSLPF